MSDSTIDVKPPCVRSCGAAAYQLSECAGARPASMAQSIIVVDPRQAQINVVPVMAAANGGFVASELPYGVAWSRSFSTTVHSKSPVERSNSVRGLLGSVTEYIWFENVAHARVMSTSTPVISFGGQYLNSALGICRASSLVPAYPASYASLTAGVVALPSFWFL